VDLDSEFEIVRSLPHGYVAAVLGVLRDLGLDRLICRERCRERDLVVAMVCQRLLDPCSKLSTTRLVHQTTLAQELGLGDVGEAELLAAMDWLYARQERIEAALARRHLMERSDARPAGPQAVRPEHDLRPLLRHGGLRRQPAAGRRPARPERCQRDSTRPTARTRGLYAAVVSSRRRGHIHTWKRPSIARDAQAGKFRISRRS